MATTCSRRKLASYASALGRGSDAEHCLNRYDQLKANGRPATILMTNNGFRIDEERKPNHTT